MGMRSFSLCSVLAACVGVGLLSAPASGASIGVHWDHSGAGSSLPTGIAGVVPQAHWNGIVSNWEDSGVKSVTVDSAGAAVTVGVSQFSVAGAGTYWWGSTGNANIDGLLQGSYGGGGTVVNVITGIPYADYEIIAYLNCTQAASATMNAWVDSQPLTPSLTNPAAGGLVYYGTAIGAPGGTTPVAPTFTQITNTTLATPQLGSYVVFSGLTGSTQALWLTSDNANTAIESFQIVDTSGVPEPASLSLLGAGALLLISRRRK